MTWMDGSAPRWFTRPETVTHPGINRPRRRVTTLIETNALPQSQTTNCGILHIDHAYVQNISSMIGCVYLLFIYFYCWPPDMRWLSTSVCPSVVRPVVISKNAHGTAQPAVVVADRPVTPCLTDIDSPSASYIFWFHMLNRKEVAGQLLIAMATIIFLHIQGGSKNRTVFEIR